MADKDNKNLIVGVAVAIGVLIILGFFGFGFRDYEVMGGFGMMGVYPGYNGGFMLFSWAISILVIVLVISGIYWLIKNINFNERRQTNGKIK